MFDFQILLIDELRIIQGTTTQANRLMRRKMKDCLTPAGTFKGAKHGLGFGVIMNAAETKTQDPDFLIETKAKIQKNLNIELKKAIAARLAEKSAE